MCGASLKSLQRTFAPHLQAYKPMLDHLKGVLAAFYQVRITGLRQPPPPGSAPPASRSPSPASR
jgi:hypothetical protein